MSYSWNPWHGCKACSPGCRHCFIRKSDERKGRDSSKILLLEKQYDRPIARYKNGSYVIPSGAVVYICFESDFFLPEADLWREKVWVMIRERQDLRFVIPTKRVCRIKDCLPADWKDGYDNVSIAISVENQALADQRLRELTVLPLKHRMIFAAPLLEELDLRAYLKTGQFSMVSISGESDPHAGVTHLSWIESLFAQCKENRVRFHLHLCGSFLEEAGTVRFIPYKEQGAKAREIEQNLRHPSSGRQLSLF